jgi:hypothetical protein
MITPLPMLDRVIKVFKVWGRCHQKEDKAKSLKFINQKRQRYNWENNDLKDNKGLVKSDIAHPDIPAKFPGIDLESDQPHHHQVINCFKDGEDEHLLLDECPLCPNQMNDQLIKTPIIHSRSVLGINYQSPMKLVPGTPPMSITWKLTPLGSSLSWADRVRIPIATK